MSLSQEVVQPVIICVCTSVVNLLRILLLLYRMCCSWEIGVCRSQFESDAHRRSVFHHIFCRRYAHARAWLGGANNRDDPWVYR